ncbi:MAG: tRNA (N(6)-L-threonylcarbamoyladenosine(37)-C(2))-methylthiotransferase MtaB [Treponema sp.]|nr:tRNA (N(6)-L-threonylcarbamoyladenosine(37)-C(2))-methylthiotransferase MtaB [Treponema sp.]
MFFSVFTQGCKLNQLESEAITEAFCRQGYALLPKEDPSAEVPSEATQSEPALILVNTCTVTSMAEQKARRLIRKALRDFPQARLIVTGCYAQMEKEAIFQLGKEFPPQRLFVIPGAEKDRLLDPPASPGSLAAWLDSLNSSPGSIDSAFRFAPENFSSHSRAFLKIQDGCDNSCAYCRVSLARGKSRSLEAAEVLRRLAALEERGFNEAVLTGVNISQFNSGGMGLAELLEFLLKGTSSIRLRLSSIEPDSLGPEGQSSTFFRALENPRIRPHFHISLQSASPAVLAKMGRNYTPSQIEQGIKRLRSVKDDPFLACDLIAGFPGESPAAFEETFAFCREAGFAWIHAFPFSRRPGTPAANFPQRVNEKEARRRVDLLTELARLGRAAYTRRWQGREVEAIVESGSSDGFVTALSENYLKLRISYDGNEAAPAPGSLIRCKV